MAKNQKRRPTKAEAGAKIAPASVNRGGGYYDQKTSEDQLAYIERQLAAGERARQNRQAPEDDGEYWNLESESEQIAYIENQLKVAEQNRQTRQEAATRKASGKVARPDGVQTTAEPAAKSGKTPYDQTAAQQQRRASADYWQQAAEQAATAQDREQAYNAVNGWLEAVPAAKELWELDRGNHPQQAMGTLRRRAQELYNSMTEQERRTYDRMSELYDSYGRLWSMGHRAVQDVTGLAQQIGGSFATLPQALGAAIVDNSREAAAQSIMNAMLANGTAFVQDENGDIVESEAFRRAREDFEAGRAEAETVLTPENSPGVALYQAGSERVANAQAGLGDGAKFAVNTANSIAANLPTMALAPVTAGGSLALMGAQAAGGRAAELSMEGETATRALTRGLVSGGIEVLTEKVPVGEWVNLVKGPAREGVQQAVMAVLRQMGSEATEEAASYVLNYAADVAAQDPNAEFSLAELAENALGGAISGGVYGGVGVGVNRMLNRGVRTQQNAGQDAAEPAPQDAPQEGAGTAQAAAAEADGTQEGRQGEAAAEAENGQPRTTYEQAQAAELGRLFGLQPNAAAAKMQQDAGSAAPAQQGTVSAGDVQNQRQVEQLAAELELPERAARTLAADYDGSASPAVYAKAWTDAYDAGRTGSLTEAQALRAAGSAAAVAGQEDALRRAYALGAQEAGNLAGAAPAGTARRGGTVEYQGTGASVVPDEVLQAVAARYGVDVDVVNELASEDGRAANGMWAAGIARITLGENSGNSYQTLNHELTHYIDSVNPEGWARLKNQILVYAASQGMSTLQEQAVGRYENAYGRGAIAADEAARDILAGVMSTEENVQTFCEHVAADQTASPQEKRSILQALRDMLDKVVQTLRSLVHRGDAAAGSEYGRRLAEAQDSRALVETYLAELDAAAEVQRGGAQEAGQQNAPAASAGAQEYSIDPNFDREIVAWDEEGRNGRRIFRLGSTGEALQSIGVQDRSIVMVSDKVRTILREHPNVTLDMIRQIPAMLENPVLVLESKGRSMRPGTRQNSRIVVVGNVTDANGAPVLCVLDLAPQSAQDRRLGLQDFNKVSSAYPKDVNPAGFLKSSNVLYANPDTNKTQDALNSFGFKLATSELNHLGSMGSIAYSGNDVKIQGVPFEEAFGAAQDGTSSARRKLQPTKIEINTVKQASANSATDTTDSDGDPSANNMSQGSQIVNSLPVQSDEQLQQQMQQAQEETRRLQEERDAWEDSQEVRALKARRLQMREQLGLFGIKNWDEATPEWQAYVDRRKEYNARINQSRERADALHSELLASGRKRQEQREQREQAAYNAEVQRSGVGREEFRRRKAVEEFGTTREFGEAGYILPDGRMLDFKGEGGTKGQRGMDHRQIADVFSTNELGRERTAYMNRFIADGNVRVMAEEPGVDISAEARPTDAQLEQIRKMANSLGASKRKFGLDFSATNGKQVASRWYEGRVRGDRVVQDIREFYRTGKLPVQSEMDAYRYSRAETDARRDLARENRELARRNMHLEEQVQLLKEETQLSEGHRIDPRRVDELARRLVREYESGYDASQLKGELTRLFDYIANDPEANYTDAMDTAQRLMRGVLEQSRRANTELRDAYKPVRDDLRSMTIEVQKESPAYYELLNEYGDGPGGRRWGNVRRNTFGRVNLKLVDGPGNWDTQFAELAENHPAVFDAEAGAAENVAAALGVFEASEVSYDNPYGMDLDTAAENAAQELFEAYMEMPERHTYADRQRQKALETRTRYREQRQRALAEQKGRYENRLAELRQKNAGQIQAMRDENTKKLVEQKAVFDERMARRNEGLRYRQARDQAEKNLRRLHRWLVQPTDAQHVPEKMRGAVAEVLNAISFNTHNAGSRADTDLKLALRDIQSLVADPDPSGDSLEYADFDPDLKGMIDEFIDSAPKDREGRISAKDLSAVQMQQLNGVLTSVTHSITTANRLLAEGRNTKLADVAAKSVEEIGSRTESRLRERRGWVKKVMDSDLGERAENLAGLDMMDAGSYFRSLGPAAEKIFGAIREGFNTRVFKIRAGQEFMQNLLRRKNLAEWSGDKAPKQTFALEKGGTLELTPGQAMELYCLTQRKQAHQHLVQGGVVLETRPGKLSARVALTPTDIAKITGSLTPEQVRVAQQMQKYLSTTVAGWGNETSMELYGIRKFGEKNYWPIKSSDNYTRTNDANSGGEPGLWGIKNAGMTKAVKINANNPLVLHDAFDTWYNHVAQMASYNAWAVPLSDAMKWYNWHDANNASVKEAIEGLYGSKGKSYFTTLMKDLNGMSDKPSQTGFEKAVGALVRPWKVAKVGANLRVIIQQPTSYLRAAAVINPKYLTQALSQAPAHLKEGIRNAEKYSAISQWANWGFFETNLGQSMRSVMIGDQTARERLQELATAPAGAMDRMTRGVLWLACEDEVRAAQPELKGEALMQAVAKRLDEVIDRTQVVDTVLHRSHIMRSKSQYAQMAMNFMAEPTKTWNMMREAAVELAHTQPKSEARAAAGKKLARVTGTYIVTALGTAAAAALMDSWRVKDEDKDKKWLERYGQAVFENWQDNVNLLGSLPLVKDIFSLLQGYDIERTDMAAFADMIDSVSVLWKAVQGEGNASAYDLIRALAEPVSGLTGVPVSNAARELKSIYDFATQLQDPLRLDRSLYADPEAVTYLDMVAQVRGEGGNLNRLKQLYGTSGSGAATYAEMLGGDQAEKVDRWLTALSEKTGEDGKANTAVLPKRVSNKVSWSQDGQDMLVYLSGPEYLAYAETVQKTSCKLIADYMAGAGAEEEPEEQAKFVKTARDYAVQAARAEAIPDYAVDDWVADIQAQGGDVAKLLTARLTIQEAESDRDAEGNAISGSRAKNAVQELVAQGYNVAEARAMYEGTTNADDSRYLQLYDDVKGNSRQANELAALFGAAGEDATYAGMLGQGNAKRVDTYLQNLARTAGDDVLPDYMAAMFSYTKDGESQKVELNGREYIEYAGQRTETAYDLLSLFMTDAKRFDSDLQADMVRSVENYATQTAKAEVSDYEPDSWVQKVQAQAGTSTGDIYTLLLARQLIYAAEGQKDANGKTISGTKKAAAIRNLENAGYSQAYAQELYKLFG